MIGRTCCYSILLVSNSNLLRANLGTYTLSKFVVCHSEVEMFTHVGWYGLQSFQIVELVGLRKAAKSDFCVSE